MLVARHSVSWLHWCFQTVVLEKTLESPFESKEIKPVNPKRNQPWIFIGRTDAEAESYNTLVTWCKEPTHWKRPWWWERLGTGGEGDNRGWDGGWYHQLSGHEFEQTLGDGAGQGGLGCCSPRCSKESDTTEWLNSSSKVPYLLYECTTTILKIHSTTNAYLDWFLFFATNSVKWKNNTV